MTVIKRYRNMSVRTAAALIAEEVIKNGKSEGWSGDIEEKDAVAEILEKYNIRYVDDMRGGWEYCPPCKEGDPTFSIHADWEGTPGTSYELCDFNWKNNPPDEQLRGMSVHLRDGLPSAVHVKCHRTGKEKLYQ